MTDEFRADIERRTKALTERLDAFALYGPNVVHPFVVTTLRGLIDLIGYHSDSAMDEFQNSIDPYVDAPDYAEEYAACGYDNELFSDPTSAEYRAFATEVDNYFAVYNHLSDREKEMLRSLSDVWNLYEQDCADDEEFDHALRQRFDNVMTEIERLK